MFRSFAARVLRGLRGWMCNSIELVVKKDLNMTKECHIFPTTM